MDSDTGTRNAHSAESGALVASKATSKTNSHPISHFNRLPVELVLEVMKNCPDFTTLWGLIHTKKLHIAVFNMEPVKIVECIMTRLYDAEHPLNILIRHVVDIRFGNYAFSTWVALGEITENAEVPLPFSRDLPPLLMHQLVQLAHKIHLLAHMAIQQGLWRFKNDFKAARCWHPTHRFDCGARGVGFKVPQVSLLAEERAILAFWRLQYFLELKAAAKGDLLQFWSMKDRTRMLHLRPVEFFSEYFVTQQVASATNLLDVMRRQPGVPHIVEDRPFRLPSMTEIARSLAAAGGPVNMSELVCHPSTTNLNPRAVTMEPFAYQFLTRSCYPPRWWTGRIRYLPVRVFQKYGVLFWDHTMLAESGLLPENILELRSNRRLQNECFLKWLGLLELEEEDVEIALAHALNRPRIQ